MKKVFVLFTVVMVMAVMVWDKQSGKPIESEFILANVEALAGGEGIVQVEYYCAGSGYCSIDGEAYDGTKYKF